MDEWKRISTILFAGNVIATFVALLSFTLQKCGSQTAADTVAVISIFTPFANIIVAISYTWIRSKFSLRSARAERVEPLISFGE